jgi:hypothetical protein
MSWSRQTRPQDPDFDETKADPIEGRPDEDVYPRRNSEQVREKQPGTRTREEIQQRKGQRRKP